MSTIKAEESEYFFGYNKDKMNAEEYIEYINNISKYYFERCEKYKKRFYLSCSIRIIASALIPVISLATVINWSSVVVSILAAIITITEGYVNVSRAYEKWTNYLQTCNALWIEQRLFAMQVGDYADQETRLQTFVNRCEGFMIDETQEWKRYIERAREMK